MNLSCPTQLPNLQAGGSIQPVNESPTTVSECKKVYIIWEDGFLSGYDGAIQLVFNNKQAAVAYMEYCANAWQRIVERPLCE